MNGCRIDSIKCGDPTGPMANRKEERRDDLSNPREVHFLCPFSLTLGRCSLLGIQYGFGHVQ